MDIKLLCCYGFLWYLMVNVAIIRGRDVPQCHCCISICFVLEIYVSVFSGCGLIIFLLHVLALIFVSTCPWYFQTNVIGYIFQNIALNKLVASFKLIQSWPGSYRGWINEHCTCIVDISVSCELHILPLTRLFLSRHAGSMSWYTLLLLTREKNNYPLISISLFQIIPLYSVTSLIKGDAKGCHPLSLTYSLGKRPSLISSPYLCNNMPFTLVSLCLWNNSQYWVICLMINYWIMNWN